ncbi:PH domain-containing protein [Brevibacterium ihuae]|uniref:PH domain-containing protein n=1 Tax=Brevibacterium ihuae TaxID=1631743 RepID=UPI000C781C48|nr:PH domain-containing protein [Brevibacterium ihuae]
MSATPHPGPEDPRPDPVGPAPTGSSTDFTTWRRVHPLTPALKSWVFIVASVGVILAQSQQFLQDIISGAATASDGPVGWLLEHPLVLLGIVGGILGFIALVAVLNWLIWRRTGFHIDDDSIYLRQGLLNRQHRSARLDRVQAIDINQPLVPRLFGLAALRFDVAGGKGSSVDLEYLARARAEELRDALLERVRTLRAAEAAGTAKPAGAPSHLGDGQAAGGHTDPGREAVAGSAPGPRPADAASGPGSAPRARGAGHRTPATNLGGRILASIEPTAAGVGEDLSRTITEVLAPYRVRARAEDDGRILRIPAHTVLLSGILSTETIITALFVFGAVIALIVLAVLGLWQAVAATAAGVFPAIAAGFAVLKRPLDEANFSVAVSEDGLTVTHGLTTTTRRIIPLDRIQAVKLSQPLLWRMTDWWRAEYTIAGQAEEEKKSTTLLPVGSLDQCLLMLGLVLPHPEVPHGVSGRALMVQAMYADRSLALARTTGDPGTPDGRAAEHGAASDAESRGYAEGQAAESREHAEAQAAEALFRGQAPASKWLDPLTYKRNGRAATGSMLVIRHGRLGREVVCVPHARVQSMRLSAGPVQRALGLASVDLHSTAGPAKPRVHHLDAADAEAFFFEHAEVTRRARAAIDAHSGPGADDAAEVQGGRFAHESPEVQGEPRARDASQAPGGRLADGAADGPSTRFTRDAVDPAPPDGV